MGELFQCIYMMPIGHRIDSCDWLAMFKYLVFTITEADVHAYCLYSSITRIFTVKTGMTSFSNMLPVM